MKTSKEAASLLLNDKLRAALRDAGLIKASAKEEAETKRRQRLSKDFLDDNKKPGKDKGD